MLALKANRPALFEDVRLLLDDPPAPPDEIATTTDGDHGRIKTRRAAIVHDIAWLAEGHGFPGLKAIKVTATREQDGRTTTATRYYLLSRPLTAARFLAVVRAHWQIENRLHWVLDVVLDEDQARARKRCMDVMWRWSSRRRHGEVDGSADPAGSERDPVPQIGPKADQMEDEQARSRPPTSAHFPVAAESLSSPPVPEPGGTVGQLAWQSEALAAAREALRFFYWKHGNALAQTVELRAYRSLGPLGSPILDLGCDPGSGASAPGLARLYARRLDQRLGHATFLEAEKWGRAFATQGLVIERSEPLFSCATAAPWSVLFSQPLRIFGLLRLPGLRRWGEPLSTALFARAFARLYRRVGLAGPPFGYVLIAACRPTLPRSPQALHDDHPADSAGRRSRPRADENQKLAIWLASVVG